MKRIFIYGFLFLGWQSLSAQDILVRKNGDIEKVYVQEVTPTQVQYKRGSNLDSRVYVENKSSLISIQFENGVTERFSDDVSKPQKTPNTIAENVANTAFVKNEVVGKYYYEPISKKWRNALDVYGGMWDNWDEKYVWGVGYHLQRNFNNYIACDVLKFSYISSFKKKVQDFGIFNVRIAGFKLYSPAYKILRAYSYIDFGYSHSYRAEYVTEEEIGGHVYAGKKYYRVDSFAFDFGVGLQVFHNLNVGYNLTYIHKFDKKCSHWVRLSFEI